MNDCAGEGQQQLARRSDSLTTITFSTWCSMELATGLVIEDET
jgi:hypothetical protein